MNKKPFVFKELKAELLFNHLVVSDYFSTPQTIAQTIAPLFMGFPRQEYWNGLQFPFLGDHPDLGIKPTFPTTAGGFFITEPPGRHEIKRCLLLGRKAIAKLDNMLQSRDTLPTKVCIVKTMVFPVVMYGCDSWTIKKVECQRIDAFELWCWRRFLRVPWTARRSNQ